MMKTPILKMIPMAALGLLFVGTTACSEDEMMEETPMMSMTYDYALSGAYEGTHPDGFSATLTVEEIDSESAMVKVTLNNTVSGETYMIHAHDAADANNTPNGTPYNESPNAGVLALMAEGNGGTVTVMQNANMSYEELTASYEGFFVVHDPTQDLSTSDITTFLAVGAFAR